MAQPIKAKDRRPKTKDQNSESHLVARDLEHERCALSGWPMIVCWIGMLIFACHACTRMVGAGDTWVAMACGRHFLNHGVDTVEPFSANSHRPGPTPEEIETWPSWAQRIVDKVGLETVKKWHPTGWINQNWLTHVIFYWLTHKSPLADADTFSFNTVVYWKFAIYIIAVICVFYTARLLGANPALSAVFACFAMFISRSFIDIRPAGFSNLMVAVFLLILVLATYRNMLYIWLLVPITVFWCNVHGGYIYVFITLSAFFAVHLLIILPRRWTVPLCTIGIWMVLYLMAYKFLSHPHLRLIPVRDDRFFYLLVILAAAGFITTVVKQVKSEVLYGYYIIISLIVFLWLLARFFPEVPFGINREQIVSLREHITQSRRNFMVISAGLAALSIVVTFLKDKLVRLKPRDICQIAAAGLVSFLAMVVFNPFHLTNLTHTFIISISEHAKMWRTVHEWRPAFEWSNAVGTGFPFLVMFIMGIGLSIFWLFSRLIFPKLYKASKDELEAQKQWFNKVLKVFEWLMAVFIGWVTFISFSLLNNDATSFIICTIFVIILLLSIYKNVHFIYLVVPLTLLGLWAADADTGYNGRYFYPFVLLPSYIMLHIFVWLFSKTVEIKLKNIIFVAGSAVAALILMVIIFNPFKFELSVWHLKQFLHLQRVWHPRYEYIGGERLNYKYLFAGLYIVNIAAIIIWLTIPYLRKLFSQPPEVDEELRADTYQPPKIDLALMSIAALTIYMAICSRRFIPIAAIAGCPILAMFIDQMTRTISAARNFHKHNYLVVGPMSRNLQTFLASVGVVVVLVIGIGWGLKFKRVYLDAWPKDTKLNSVFMRMTASDAKPFWAGQFIKDNKLKGKMFNYWTEGGFIAYAQQPDPNTGKTPLQLFMDGRAQAAYNPRAYELWRDIMGGGPITGQIVNAAMARRRAITTTEYRKIGNWIDKQLKDRDVWVILMPLTTYNDPRKRSYHFVKGLEYHPNWRLVFFNNKQKLFVDITTTKGKELFDGIFDGKTLYPDEFSRNLIVAYYRLRLADETERKKGLDYAIKAFELNPSQVPILEIIFAARFSELKPRVDEFCKNYVDNFTKNKNHTKEHGFYHRIIAVLRASEYLRRIAEMQKNTELVQFYSTKIQQYDNELRQLLNRKTW